MTESFAFVALLDVLGYRYHLDRDKRNGTTDFQTQLQNALGVLSEINENEIQYQAISDTIIFTTSQHEKFSKLCEALRCFFKNCIANGLFVRGGISFGQYFKNTHVTYSQALAKSYQLESRSAIYPRILVDTNIITMAEEDPRLLIAPNQLIRRNSAYFINPVLTTDDWREIYDASSRMYNAEREVLELDESAFLKHVWIQDFLLNHPMRPDYAVPYIESFILYPG